jgi:hypothetical protein
MKPETITVINRSGTEITISFDAINLVDESHAIGLRIPAQSDKYSNVIVIEAHKDTYPTSELFLERIEQFGKQQIAEWIRTSSDTSIIMPQPHNKHWWTIGYENGNKSTQTP